MSSPTSSSSSSSPTSPSLMRTLSNRFRRNPYPAANNQIQPQLQARSLTSTSSKPVCSPSPTTGKLDLHYVPDSKPVFSCQKCSEVIALQDETVSKAFTGKYGAAYLLNTTINTNLGKREERRLLTGHHTVADLLCASCDTSLGWMYIRAPNGEQRYKEGRYILETAKIVKENNW